MPRIRCNLAAMTFAIALSAAPPARAQSKEDLARADALFNAAKALTDAGQYADACTKFAESKRLAPGLGVTLYLADCYERIGRIGSAWAEFRSAEGLARERNDKRADVARGRAQALEPRLNRLTVNVAPSVPRSGLQVLRDGIPVAQEELGLPIVVDPGAHVVVVSLPGHKARTLNVRVDAAGQSTNVDVDRLDDEAATPAPAPEPAPSPPSSLAGAPATALPPPIEASAPREERSSSLRWIGLGVGGLGVVGIGVGSALGLVAMSKRDQSNQNGRCDSTDHCTGEGLSLRKDAESSATGSTIAFVAGGVALAAGVVLYVMAPQAQRQRGQTVGAQTRATRATGPTGPTTGLTMTIAPVPMAGGAGAAARFTF